MFVSWVTYRRYLSLLLIIVTYHCYLSLLLIMCVTYVRHLHASPIHLGGACCAQILNPSR